MKMHNEPGSLKNYNIGFLLEYNSHCPELYNEIANHLYYRFNIQSAEISLLITYYVNEERRKNNDKINSQTSDR